MFLSLCSFPGRATVQGHPDAHDFTTKDLARCRELVAQYRDMPLGIADAAVVATAERLKIQRLLSVDERHFRVVRPCGFDNFILLPTDQE